jgi:hypothetical protein
VKWVICIYGIIFGTYPLGAWMSEMVHISRDAGMDALANPTFLHNQKMLCIFGPFQVATLIFVVFITALKPWRRRKAKIQP